MLTQTLTQTLTLIPTLALTQTLTQTEEKHYLVSRGKIATFLNETCEWKNCYYHTIKNIKNVLLE